MRVTRQELRIERLRLEGHDTARAERLLSTLMETLAEWNAHRGQILRTIQSLRDP